MDYGFLVIWTVLCTILHNTTMDNIHDVLYIFLFTLYISIIPFTY